MLKTKEGGAQCQQRGCSVLTSGWGALDANEGGCAQCQGGWVLNATEEVLATNEGRVLHANEEAELNANELERGCSMPPGGACDQG